MLIQMQVKNELDQVHIFQYIDIKCFQIHLQAIMYHFECINHDNNQYFLFQSFSILFLHAYNQHL